MSARSEHQQTKKTKINQILWQFVATFQRPPWGLLWTNEDGILAFIFTFTSMKLIQIYGGQGKAELFQGNKHSTLFMIYVEPTTLFVSTDNIN